VVRRVFNLSVRLLICLVAAKFLLRFIGWDNVRNLIMLTLLLLANLYWFDLLDYREFKYIRRRQKHGLTEIKAGDSET